MSAPHDKGGTAYRPFIPRWLDDLALTPHQFRVACHLWRRADRDSICWPSAATIAESCRINSDTVWTVLRDLERMGLLVRSKGARNSNHYKMLLPVGGKEGVTQLAEKEGWQSAETGGRQLAETEGLQLAERRGHKGIPRKVPQGRFPNEGGRVAPAPEVSFPWKEIGDLPEECRAELESNHESESDRIRIFNSIRGEFIRFRNKHTTEDWPDVFKSAMESRTQSNEKPSGRALFA